MRDVRAPHSVPALLIVWIVTLWLAQVGILLVGESALVEMRDRMRVQELAAMLAAPIEDFERTIANRPSLPSLMAVDTKLVETVGGLPGIVGASLHGPSGNLIAATGTPAEPSSNWAGQYRTAATVPGAAAIVRLQLEYGGPIAIVDLPHGLEGQTARLVLVPAIRPEPRLRTDFAVVVLLLGAATLALSHLPRAKLSIDLRDPRSIRLERASALVMLIAIGAIIALLQALAMETAWITASIERLLRLGSMRHLSTADAAKLLHHALPDLTLAPPSVPSALLPGMIHRLVWDGYDAGALSPAIALATRIRLAAPLLTGALAVGVAAFLIWWPLQPLITIAGESRRERGEEQSLSAGVGAIGWALGAAALSTSPTLGALSGAAGAGPDAMLVLGEVVVLCLAARLHSQVLRTARPATLAHLLLFTGVTALAASALSGLPVALPPLLLIATILTVTGLCLLVRFARERDLAAAARRTVMQAAIGGLLAGLLAMSLTLGHAEPWFQTGLVLILLAIALAGLRLLPDTDALLMRRTVRITRSDALIAARPPLLQGDRSSAAEQP